MLQAYNPPHIRYKDSNKTVMDDVLIVFLALYFMAAYYYGARAVLLGLFAAGTALLCDVVCKIVLRRKITIRERSSIVTGLMIPLLMPASVPYSIAAVAVVFALVVVKYPFGGEGHNLFNPAAAGFAFAAICFPKEVFSYPAPLEHLPLADAAGAKTVLSSAYALKAGGVPTGDLLEVLLGNVAGPMGATHVLVVCACLLYLLVRGVAHWQSPVFFLGTCALFAFLFPRASISGISSVLYELSSGFLFFGAVFMMTDPVTSPKRGGSAALYAVVAGVATMLFRRFGGFEEGFPFALLLCNAFSQNFDFLGEIVYRRLRRGQFVSGQNEKV